MLMAHPAVLPGLVNRYWALSVLDAAEGESPVRTEIEDVERALCVATGTTDVHAALIATRHRLPGTGALDDSVLVSGSSVQPSAGVDRPRTAPMATAAR